MMNSNICYTQSVNTLIQEIFFYQGHRQPMFVRLYSFLVKGKERFGPLNFYQLYPTVRC